MIRRLVIALLALLVAGVGGVLTFLYASGADARAMARLEPVQVLVAAEPIAAGTEAEVLARSVTIAEIPAAAVVPGGIVDLGEVAGLRTNTELQPGEQLLSARFVPPEAVPVEFEVPADMHQLSIRLDAQRVLGGEISAGDTVGVFMSSALDADSSAAEGSGGSFTHLVLNKVLVTAVQGATSTTTDAEGQEAEVPAADQLTVTLALTAPDAEMVVFGQEFGSLWLSLEGADVPESGTRPVNPGVLVQ